MIAGHFAIGARIPCAVLLPCVFCLAQVLFQVEHCAWSQDSRRPSSPTGQRSNGPTGNQAAANPSSSGDSQQPAAKGFFGIVFSGGWFGAVIIFLLLALSLTAAYLVFDQVMSIRRGELMPTGLSEHIRKLVAAGQVAEADQACRAHPSFLSFILLRGLSEMEGGWPAVEKALEEAVAEQSARLFRKIEYLSVIGNIAPMIGLLGTVTGMLIAFQQVAATRGAAGAAELAEGIYQALVTTVAGLIVAIPSLGAFAIFRNRVDQFVAESAFLAQHVFSSLKRRRASLVSPPPKTKP